MKRHHYRIVNPLRFFLFVLITTLLITFGAFSLFNNNAEAASVNTYIQVTVQQNDNLWSIAEDYCSSKIDIRRFVDEICETNDIDVNDYLIPGDIIFVPLH